MLLSSAPSTPSTIDLNHPSLNTPIHLADPDRPYLQHGLEYDELGQVRIKPEIESKMRPSEIKLVHALIAAGRLSEANSIVGCRRICKPLSHCPDNHEVIAARVICDRPLLHEACATGVRRAIKFTCEHPKLAEFLFRNRFEVFTLTIPGDQWTLAAHEYLRGIFNMFIKLLGDGHGWMRSISFAAADGMVEARVIHYHKKGLLGGWPTIEAIWQRVAPPGSTLSIYTFDNRDGDTQAAGLRYATEGFEDYWTSIRPGDELRLSLEFRDYSLTNLYGYFRAFSTEKAHAPFPVRCSECSQEHVSAHHMPLLPEDELGKRYKRILKPTYVINLWRPLGRHRVEVTHSMKSPPN
jgi:hypothetical protein